MEQQIHQFQSEVDRRLEEQERHMKRMVEERVQQELDSILATEVVKVQAMVEERVRERVVSTFRREVRETVHELQSKLDSLVDENELLRDAFAEANFRSKCQFWALHPPPLLGALNHRSSRHIADIMITSMKRRSLMACCWHPGLEHPSAPPPQLIQAVSSGAPRGYSIATQAAAISLSSQQSQAVETRPEA